MQSRLRSVIPRVVAALTEKIALRVRFFSILLNEHLFANLKEARQIIEEWRIDYNTNRPHTRLKGLTPTEFATRSDQGQYWNRVYV